MDELDKLIQNRIKNQFDIIEPEKDTVLRIMENVKNDYGKKHIHKLHGIHYKAAAIILVALLVINANTIMAVMSNIYEKFFTDIGKTYEYNTSEYTRELNKTVMIGETNVVIKQYVVTGKGVDFKISLSSDSNIELAGCEVKLENGEILNAEMFAKSNGEYISSNVFEAGSWDKIKKKSVNATLVVLYMEGEDSSTLHTAKADIKMDLSKVYQGREIISDHIIEDTDYLVKSIYLGAWYMKVSFQIKKEQPDFPMLVIKQGDKELLFLGGKQGENVVQNYYQLIDNGEEVLYVTLAKAHITDEGTEIEKADKTYKIKIDNDMGGNKNE